MLVDKRLLRFRLTTELEHDMRVNTFNVSIYRYLPSPRLR